MTRGYENRDITPYLPLFCQTFSAITPIQKFFDKPMIFLFFALCRRIYSKKTQYIVVSITTIQDVAFSLFPIFVTKKVKSSVLFWLSRIAVLVATSMTANED